MIIDQFVLFKMLYLITQLIILSVKKQNKQ